MTRPRGGTQAGHGLKAEAQLASSPRHTHAKGLSKRTFARAHTHGPGAPVQLWLPATQGGPHLLVATCDALLETALAVTGLVAQQRRHQPEQEAAARDRFEEPRVAADQFCARARRRHGAAGQLGPPGRRDGLRAHRAPAVAEGDAVQPGGPVVAQPRPVCALQRARVRPPVRDAPPDGLRPLARRPARVPPDRLEDAGAPRGGRDGGRRGGHGAARAGPLQRRRARASRGPHGRHLQPRGLQGGGPLRVRHLRRRVHAGGHHERGVLARGSPGAGPPDRLLRRQ